LKVDVVSRKYGWYLAKITASIENFKNIVATSLETIKKYNLNSGRYIKISSLIQAHSKRRFLDKFILLPYFREFIRNYCLLQDVIQSLTNATFQYVDKEYISDYQMKIAMPESWLNEHSIDLGETVLLRNDVPSPVIL